MRVFTFSLILSSLFFNIARAQERIPIPKRFENPKKEIETFTKTIRDAEDQGISFRELAEYYRLRGLAWKQLKEKPEPKAWYLDRSKAPLNNLAPIDLEIKDYTESLRLHPLQAEVYRLRGQAWFHIAQEIAKAKDLSEEEWSQLITYHDEAIADFDRAIRIDERDADTLAARAETRAARAELELKKVMAELTKLTKSIKVVSMTAHEKAKEAVDARKETLAVAKKWLKEAADEHLLKKDHWLLASNRVMNANKDELAALQKILEHAAAELNTAKAALDKTRQTVAQAEQELDAANRKLKPLEDAIKARPSIAEKARVYLAALQTEYESIIGDYNDALRRTGTLPELTKQRDNAVKAWAEARADLRKYIK